MTLQIQGGPVLAVPRRPLLPAGPLVVDEQVEEPHRRDGRGHHCRHQGKSENKYRVVCFDGILPLNEKSCPQELTPDVHIGFGSFVEKNLPPFTSTISSFNCDRDNPDCSPPYR